jgi:hypothetical protein
MAKNRESVLTVIANRPDRTVTPDQKCYFWQLAMAVRPVPRSSESLIHFYRLFPFQLDWEHISRLMPNISAVSIYVSAVAARNRIEVVSPWPTADIVTPRVGSKVKLETASAPLRIMQKEKVIKKTHRLDAAVLKESKKRARFRIDARVLFILGHN